MIQRRLTGAMLALMTMAEAGAQTENLAWHGFVAQGITSSTDSHYITDDNDITAELTEAGINATYILNSSLSVAGQLVYLDGGNRFSPGTRVDYLFVDWRVRQQFDWQLNVHFGRYKNRHWLYSATQDVPQTRPSITLPQSIYYDGNRDVALSSDGIAIQSTSSGNTGTWDVRWSYGRSPLGKDDSKKLLSPQVQGRVKQDFVHQFSTYWRPDASQLQLGVSLLQSEFTYDPAKQDILLSGDSMIDRITLAARYDSENWELSMELLRDRLIYQGTFANGLNLDVDKTGEGGYIQWRYFLTQNVTALARIDTYDVDRQDRKGKLLEQSPFGMIPAHYGYMDEITLGLSVDITSQVRLSGEYSRVRGAGRIAPVLFPDALIYAQPYWSNWSLQLMYWF
ncbi:TonB-dependent receptor [Alteromonas gilva]|uniref:TonB-dependent receptor n=1 Tax=Alteromonas gilva TaxID=2987522 RepID=A0ABT5L461_9ALTE|nr:TonB-dependent receptor [Alteromonas gilva]MDC8831841.1 TonB-dependent receptor [Alteromonas gilva]